MIHFFQNRDIQTLLPLTAKQITDACVSAVDKSEFVIDSVDVNNVGLLFLFFFFVFKSLVSGFVLTFHVFRLHLLGWCVKKLEELQMLLSFLTTELEGWSVTSGEFYQAFLFIVC